MTERHDRPTIDITSAPGGWPSPWQNVAELADALPQDSWTLVGGLMTQLHTIHHGLGVLRPTNDVDIVLPIETQRGIPRVTAAALEGLGYELRPSTDPRTNTAHRFVRGNTAVDVVTEATEQVDVLIADHPAPRIALGPATPLLRVAGFRYDEDGDEAWRRTFAFFGTHLRDSPPPDS